MITDLSAYEVDAARGFLSRSDPLERLPGKLEVLDELGRELPKTLMTGKVRRLFGNLPELDVRALTDEGEARRAMMILSFLGHAYVWGEEERTTSIPACLARPWHQVAHALGRPPVLSYASYALDNWRRVDPDAPVELGNVVLLQNFLGGQDEEWFVLVHVAIEAVAGPGLAAVVAAQKAVAADDPAGVADQLAVAGRVLDTMNKILLRMPERCDPHVYFRRVRPYLHGWANHPGLPDGILYEGVSEYADRPQKFRGETGAQSSIIPTFDAALGIGHADDPLRRYLDEMFDYMPPKHRSFIHAVAAGPSVRDYVSRGAHAHPALREAYNDAVRGVERFRSTHLEYVHSYIIRQSQAGQSNPNDVGTGGTPFGPYLEKHRDETKRHLIAD